MTEGISFRPLSPPALLPDSYLCRKGKHRNLLTLCTFAPWIERFQIVDVIAPHVIHERCNQIASAVGVRYQIISLFFVVCQHEIGKRDDDADMPDHYDTNPCFFFTPSPPPPEEPKAMGSGTACFIALVHVKIHRYTLSVESDCQYR